MWGLDSIVMIGEPSRSICALAAEETRLFFSPRCRLAVRGRRREESDPCTCPVTPHHLARLGGSAGGPSDRGRRNSKT